MNSSVPVSRRLIFVNSASMLITKALNITVLVWVYQYLLARISSEEFSIYPLVMSIMIFVSLFTVILTSGIGRYLVAAYAKNNTERVTQISSTFFLLLLAAAIFLTAGAGLIILNIEHILTIDPQYIMRARIMLSLPVMAFFLRLPFTPFVMGLYMRQKFVMINIVGLCMQVLQMTILGTLLFFVSTNILWLVVSTTVSEMIGFLIRISLSLRLMPSLRFRPSAVRFGLLSEVLSFGFWQLILSIAHHIRRSVDVIILNKLGTPLDVTTFHLGSTMFNQIQSVSVLATQPMMPALIAIDTMGGKNTLRRIYIRGGRYALWLVLSVTLPIIIYSREFIQLYVGETYIVSATVISLLLLQYPICYGNIMFPRIANAMARVKPLAIATLCLQIFNLMLTLYLVGIRHMGAIGSATGTLTATLIGNILIYVPMGLMLMEIPFAQWLKKTIIPGFIPSMFGMCIWLGLKYAIEPSTWTSLIVCGLSGFIGYTAGLIIFCIGPEEKNEVTRAVNYFNSQKYILSKYISWMKT